MTMADGEGRPLDEIEAGDDDPQGWYFDLPGGAWERQEEKNRTLRQRVLGNLTEEEEARKREPFATHKPAEPEKRGGLFGFGRKKKEEPKTRESAGGTWVLNPGATGGPSGPDPDAEEPDSWSTEPPLELPRQSEPILLRRRSPEERTDDPWGPSDGGFSLGSSGDDQPFEDDEGDFASKMGAWAHAGARGASHEEPAAATEDEELIQPAPAYAEVIEETEDIEWETATEAEEPVFAAVMEEEPESSEEFAPAEAFEDQPEFVAPASFVEAVAEPAESEELPAPPLLKLRPRTHDDDGKRLDWSFGPRGWDEADASPADAPAAGDDGDSLSAMRAWAERNREADHPHFTTEHKPETELSDELPALPLRPLHRDEEDGLPRAANLEAAPPVMDGPRDLPLVRRSHTEPEPARDPSQGPSKWDEFFNLSPATESAGEDEAESSPLSEGLSAMRDWAKSRPEPEKERDIPEEFLKPFDWETEEDGAPADLTPPEELLKPFDWEADDEEPTHTGESAGFEAPALAMPEAPATAQEAPAAFEPVVEADPLEGIFSHPDTSTPPGKPAKKPGLMGRLFGRKKKDAEPAFAEQEDDGEPGDWVLPGEDGADDDIRSVAMETGDPSDDDREPEWHVAATSVFANEPRPQASTGWGGSLAAGAQAEDEDTIAAFTSDLNAEDDEDQEPFAPAAYVEDLEAAEDEEPFEDEGVSEAPAVAFASEPDAFDAEDEEDGWAPEPVPTVELTAAFAASSSPTGDETIAPEPLALGEQSEEGWAPIEQDEPLEAVADLDESPFEAPVALVEDGEEPVEDAFPAAEDHFEAPVAEVTEEVIETPAVAEETPWWERPAVDDEPVEAVAEVTEEVAETPAVAEETPWWERPAVDDEPVEAVAEVTEEVTETPAVAEEKPWWERPAVDDEPVEAVAEVTEEVSETPAVTEETPWWERPAVDDEPVEAVAEVTEEVTETPAVAEEKPWWERPAVDDEPVEAVAEVTEEVSETPVAEEKPWWEHPAAVDDEPVEAVAEVTDEVAETPVAEEKPWWERPAVDDEPVEAVAEVAEEVAETPAVTEETPWWERPAVDDEPVEAVAEVAEEVSETPLAEEKPWWERPAVDDESVEAVAEVAEEVTETPAAAEERPWWERPAVDDEPVEAVAEVTEEVSETPAAEEKPWWEHPAAVDDEPVEAVAEVAEEVSETPLAEEKPWWERPAVDDEPVEAVAEVTEEVTEAPVAEEKPWWERATVIDEEPPVEAVAEVVEEVVQPPAAEPSPWWEQSAEDDEPADVAVLAGDSGKFTVPADDDSPWAEEDLPAAALEFEPEAAAAPAASDDDDPWAEFVGAADEPVSPPVAAFSAPPAWQQPPASVTPPAAESRDEDMWGDIAARAEEAMSSPVDDDGRLDLAASLERQMSDPDDTSWESHGGPDWESGEYTDAPQDDEEDVILRAFEAHAATPDKPDPEVVRETEQALAALFGQDAEEIVADTSEDGNQQSFIRMSAWAPQRSAPMDGGWAEEEEIEASMFAAGGTSDIGFAPPPWAVDEFEAGGSAAAARSGTRTKTWVREIVETALLAILVFLSVRASFQNFKVDGNSMYPTLEDGQFLIVNKLVYSEVDMEKLSDWVPFISAGDSPKRHVFHGPERGDIIVLKDPRNPETDLIKRVIGLPGETVEIVNGKVYINDFLLEEPYIKAPWSDNKAKILIPPGEYFVMGDNRDNSLDSRSSQVGLVPEDLIIGKALLSYWPKSRFGMAPNQGGELADQKPVLTTQRIGD